MTRAQSAELMETLPRGQLASSYGSTTYASPRGSRKRRSRGKADRHSHPEYVPTWIARGRQVLAAAGHQQRLWSGHHVEFAVGDAEIEVPEFTTTSLTVGTPRCTVMVSPVWRLASTPVMVTL